MPRWALVLAAIALGLGAIWVKVRVESGQAHERAEEREAAGDMDLAIAFYRDAVRWYSPGSGPVATSVDRLLAIAQAAEAAGNTAVALDAYRSLRGALFAIRSLVEPYAEHLPAINDRIAALMVDTPEDRARHRALLDRNPAPNVFWSLVAVLGFLVWVACLLLLAVRGFDDDTGRFVARQAAPWLLGFGLTAATWMVALALA